MKIIIASKNPVKIQATLQAFRAMFPTESFEIEGVRVPSGVSAQPMSDQETWIGAVNRIENAKIHHPNADYWVGIEGGIIRHGNEMETFAWIIIQSPTLQGKARTCGFFLPPKVTALVEEGYELGHADDMVFGASNSKQTSGASGLLTGNVITRMTLYQPAVVLALIPFRNKALYKGEH